MHSPKPAEPEEVDKPLIVEEELAVEKPMSVEDAMMELESAGAFFLPFIDIDSGHLRILYRKKGGNFGIINTGCRNI